MSSGHRPRRRFGQNFLHDRHVIGRILRAVAPRPGEALVEIGPGEGALTGDLLQAAGRLEAVEMDRDLVPPLMEKLGNLGELTVHRADALDFDFGICHDGTDLRLVGNLPYNISTPLLFHLLGQAGCIRDMHFMLQREVVDRMVAGPGSRTYGRLSVMVQYQCEVQRLFTVPPGAFRPAPAVDSAVVRLLPRDGVAARHDEANRLGQVVTAAFAQRRKTLRNTLRGLLGEEDLRACDVDPGSRAEQLDLPAFLRLAGRVTNPRD